MILLLFAVAASANAIKGTIDLRQNTFSKQVNIELGGEWEFYAQSMLKPGSPRFEKEEKRFRQFDKLWDKDGHAFGYATYRLHLYLPDSPPPLSLNIPEFYSSYRLYFNGKLLSKNGVVDTAESVTVPYFDPQIKMLDLKSGKNTIVLQIANFHHHKGGASKLISLQSYDQASYFENLRSSATLFLVGAFLLSCIFSLTVFLYQRHDWSFLFFGLFALLYIYRLVGADSYMLHDLLENLPWQLTLRLEYFTLYTAVGCFVMYLYYMFRPAVNRYVFISISGLSGLMALTIVLPTEIFTALIDYYLYFIALAYVVFTGYFLFTTNWLDRNNVVRALSLISLGIVLIFRISGYFNLTSQILWVSFFGYTLFILSSAVAIALRFGKNFEVTSASGEVAINSQRDFLNTMSHELRTPMNVILGMTDFLQNSDLDQKQREKVEMIKNNGESLNNILLDVLSFSEMEAGELRLEKKQVNVQECVDVAINLTDKIARKKPIDFEVKLSEEIPDKLVGDPARLKQVFVHLLSNAFKFTDKGTVLLTGNLQDEDSEYATLKFSVQDTGVGIKKSKLNSIFSAFSQAQTGNTRKFGGTGLGLTITQQIIDLMGGTLNIDSTPGKGTRVDFTVKMKFPKLLKNSESREDIVKKQEVNKNLRVLYAEDNPINQKLIKMMVKNMGLDMDLADDGKQAWEMVMKKNYDIVLMDIQMPEMDGIEATKRILNDVAERPIIVAVTANAGASDKKRAIAAGMNDFIAKPIKSDTLKEVLIKWQGLRDYLANDTITNSA